MSIKSILLHMAPDESRGERLAAAIQLAQRFGAHLRVTYLTSPVGMPAAITGRGASAAYVAEAIAVAEERAAAILQEVEAACDAAGIEWEAEMAEGDHNEELAKRSVGADLVVIGESRALLPEDYIGLHRPDELLIRSACPVLIISKGWADRPIGTRILVALRDTHESSRAAHGALPFVTTAERVCALTDGSETSEPMVEWLRRHVPSAEHATVDSEGDVGPQILKRAAEMEADLLVMGAYGHSRWRQIVLGGVTDHVLREMDLPVLMSH